MFGDRICRSAYGVEGVHYTKAEQGEVGIDGNQSLFTMIAEANDTNYKWDQLAGLVRYTEETVGVTANPDPYAEGVKPLDGRQVVMYNGSLDHEKVRQPLESVLPDLYLDESSIEEMTLLKTTIMDYSTETMVRFIIGDLDIDKDWDKYKEQLNDLGLVRYLELLQNAYNVSPFAN